MLVFHSVSEIYYKEFWLLMVNVFLIIAWIGNIEIYVNLKYDKFFATISCFVIIAIVFSTVMAGDFVAMGDFSSLSKMERGSYWSIILYIATAVFLIISFNRMDI
jgi:hypothetical protein